MIPLVLVSHDASVHDAYSMINGPIIILAYDDRSEVHHDFLGHMMLLPLPSAPYDANSIINGATALLRST